MKNTQLLPDYNHQARKQSLKHLMKAFLMWRNVGAVACIQWCMGMAAALLKTTHGNLKPTQAKMADSGFWPGSQKWLWHTAVTDIMNTWTLYSNVWRYTSATGTKNFWCLITEVTPPFGVYMAPAPHGLSHSISKFLALSSIYTTAITEAVVMRVNCS